MTPLGVSCFYLRALPSPHLTVLVSPSLPLSYALSSASGGDEGLVPAMVRSVRGLYSSSLRPIPFCSFSCSFYPALTYSTLGGGVGLTPWGVMCICLRTLPSPHLPVLVSPSLHLSYSTVLHLGWGLRTCSCLGAFYLRTLFLLSTSLVPVGLSGSIGLLLNYWETCGRVPY